MKPMQRTPLVLLLWCVGCANAGSAPGGPSGPSTEASPTGARGVVTAGAQDIAEFRSLVAARRVPDPAVLDDAGFLAEHALDFPPADCGASICATPVVAVAPRFDGGNWVTAWVGLSTSIDPRTMTRPPQHVIVLLDRWEESCTLLPTVAAGLRAEDRVSVIATRGGDVIAESRAPSELRATDCAVGTRDQPELYRALAAASALVDATPDGTAARILIAGSPSGVGSVDDAVVGLVAGFARQGTSVSAVGFGAGAGAGLGRLAAAGGGAFASATTRDDLSAALQSTLETALVPIATDATLRIEPAEGYALDEVIGARPTSASGSAVELAWPALFAGARMGSSDPGPGRRGGGAGIFVRMRALPGASSLGPNRDAVRITLRFVDAASGQTITQARAAQNALAPGMNPAGMNAFVSSPAQTKAFMALNMLAALRATLELYGAGDCRRARGVEPLMQQSVGAYQASELGFDEDIDADWRLLQQLDVAVTDGCAVVDPPSVMLAPVLPSNASVGCMMF